MLEAAVVPTPQLAMPYAVEVRTRGGVIRSEPVDSRRSADRILVRLLEDAARDWPD